MEDLEYEEQQVAKGFDRGIDFLTIKNKLIEAYNNLENHLSDLAISHIKFVGKRSRLYNRLIYTIIALIQLRCGSRISEAVRAFRKFINLGKIDGKVVVKISKSESKKKKKDTGEEFTTKARYRKMIFPTDWITIDNDKLKNFKFYSEGIEDDRMKKRVLDYLLLYFNCNTHSLRYAFINHMLFVEKKEPALIAKYVGHVNMNQIVTYTQNKQVDQLFDMEI